MGHRTLRGALLSHLAFPAVPPTCAVRLAEPSALDRRPGNSPSPAPWSRWAGVWLRLAGQRVPGSLCLPGRWDLVASMQKWPGPLPGRGHRPAAGQRHLPSTCPSAPAWGRQTRGLLGTCAAASGSVSSPLLPPEGIRFALVVSRGHLLMSPEGPGPRTRGVLGCLWRV